MSRARLTPSSFAILGLLTLGPSSGYELGSLTERTVQHFWPLTRPHIYSELSKLEQLGHVTSVEVEQRGAPDKRVYSITEHGERELDAWLRDPDPEVQRPRHPLLIKLFFAERLEPGAVRPLLESYRAGLEARRSTYAALAAGVMPNQQWPDNPYIRLTARFGERRMEADLAWLDEVEAMLASPDPGA
jgi:PadR family transcriptional regulator, regulatory protein AphA